MFGEMILKLYCQFYLLLNDHLFALFVCDMSPFRRSFDQKSGDPASPASDACSMFVIEPRCENTGLRGLRPGPTQIGLYNNRRWLEA